MPTLFFFMQHYWIVFSCCWFLLYLFYLLFISYVLFNLWILFCQSILDMLHILTEYEYIIPIKHNNVF